MGLYFISLGKNNQCQIDQKIGNHNQMLTFRTLFDKFA